MTSPTFRAEDHVVNGSASATIVVPKPAGTVSTDLLLLVWSVDDVAGTFTLPSGFTSGQTGSSTFDGQTAGWAWKIAGGSEPSSYTITITSGAVRGSGVMLAYSGVHQTIPIATQATVATNSTGNASPVSVTANSVTTTIVDTTLVWVGANDDTGNSSGYTPPTGYTERYDTGNTVSATMSVAEKIQASTTTTGTVTGTATGSSMTSGWIAFLLAIAPPATTSSDQALLMML